MCEVETGHMLPLNQSGRPRFAHELSFLLFIITTCDKIDCFGLISDDSGTRLVTT